MNKAIFTLIGILLVSCLFGQSDITAYMTKYRQTRATDVASEKSLLAGIEIGAMIDLLHPYYNDSLEDMRRKAYYLTYKKARTLTPENQLPAVEQLVAGCSDKYGSIINQNIEYLKQFTKQAYSQQAKSAIDSLLTKKKYQSFSDIFLIAGFLGIGAEPMNQLLVNPDIQPKFKWTLNLALARMGNANSLDAVLRFVTNKKSDDNLVIYIVPNLVYTRQRAAIDYCINILNETDKNCSSPNAEVSNKIVCGYRVMEILAPAIVDYPFTVDATGSINADDYEVALEQTRQWFVEHPNFQIKTDQY